MNNQTAVLSTPILTDSVFTDSTVQAYNALADNADWECDTDVVIAPRTVTDVCVDAHLRGMDFVITASGYVVRGVR